MPEAVAPREALPPPPLDGLGRDLLVTTRRQRWFALLRPPVAFVAFALVARVGLGPYVCASGVVPWRVP